MSDNKDRDVSRSDEFDKGDVTPGCFDEKVHIFWGPGQVTGDYPTYSPPVKSQWRGEQLNIPKVCRFVFTGPDEYDIHKWDFGSPDPFQVVWKFLEVSVFADYIVIYYGAYINDVFQYGSFGSYSTNRYWDYQVLGASGDTAPFYVVGMSFVFHGPFEHMPIYYSLDFNAYFCSNGAGPIYAIG